MTLAQQSMRIMPPCALLPCTHPSLPQPIATPPQVLLCSTLVVIPQHQGLEQHVNTECTTTTGQCTNSCSMSCCTQAKCSKHHSPSPCTSLMPLELLQQLLYCPPFRLLASMHTCAAMSPLVPKRSMDRTVPPLSWAHVGTVCWALLHGAPHARTLLAQHVDVEGRVDQWCASERGWPWCGMAWRCRAWPYEHVGDLRMGKARDVALRQIKQVTCKRGDGPWHHGQVARRSVNDGGRGAAGIGSRTTLSGMT